MPYELESITIRRLHSYANSSLGWHNVKPSMSYLCIRVSLYSLRYKRFTRRWLLLVRYWFLLYLGSLPALRILVSFLPWASFFLHHVLPTCNGVIGDMPVPFALLRQPGRKRV